MATARPGEDEPTRAVSRRLRAEIAHRGPIPFSRFMEAALYDEAAGFFAAGGGAGRAGRDFLTSPEVGSLFGLCVARAVDRWWIDAGRPDPFLVVEAGAGTGRLARDVLRARPECEPALRYLLVERSAALRSRQRERLSIEPPEEVLGAVVRDADDEPHAVERRGPIVTSLEELPASFDGVVFANELLDNLPVDVAHFDGSTWQEVRVGVDGGGFAEVLFPIDKPPAPFASMSVPAGTRVPVPVGAREWLRRLSSALGRGGGRSRVVAIDYVVSAEEAVRRSPGWLRSYRGHQRRDGLLDAPGSADITADVVVEQLDDEARAAELEVVSTQSQAAWLAGLGIDDLVAQGDAIWRERAHHGDRAALAGRSRGVEAATLMDWSGLGAHRVVEMVPRST